ncbi:MAG: type II/IV secretion system protein [Clostridia bacterium]|nr:type II/IV secretion system protein [Clostridia bacterium]
MKRNKEILVRLALNHKILPEKVLSLEKEIAESGKDIEIFLQENNICTEAEFYSIVADMFCVPFSEMEVLDIDKDLVATFDNTFLRKNNIVPVRKTPDGTLVVAIGDVMNMIARSAIATFVGGKVEFIQVPPSQIAAYISSRLAAQTTESALSDLEKEKTTKSQDADGEEIDDTINAPAVRLVDSVIREAIPYRASDIHIEPYENEVKVRYRVDGDLAERMTFPISSYPAVCARLKIIAGMNIAERRIPQDGRINLAVNGVEYDFRVSTLPTVHGEKFVIRVLDKSSFRFTREDLGFTPEENLIVDKILAHPYGLVLLTGPTGCGKSTTLYSFLKEVNKPDVNIVTVEDPVEYTMLGINQTQVNAKANMTFATALRSILRQDPDIIMIGEIRDEETAQIGIRAAITGHLVFSTLHTNDAVGAVTRLVDMGVSSYLVGDAIVGVISQRLVKRLCPMCKKAHITTPDEMHILGLETPQKIFSPVGCQYCNGSGFKGRLAVHEIMYVSDALRNLINQNEGIEKIRATAEASGMISLADSCKNAVLSGDTSISEFMALNAAEDTEENN